MVYWGKTVNALMVDVLFGCMHITTLYVIPCTFSEEQYINLLIITINKGFNSLGRFYFTVYSYCI